MGCYTTLWRDGPALFHGRFTLGSSITQTEIKNKKEKYVELSAKTVHEEYMFLGGVSIHKIDRQRAKINPKPQKRGERGGTVVKVLCYKSEGRWFDPSWCHWNFLLT